MARGYEFFSRGKILSLTRENKINMFKSPYNFLFIISGVVLEANAV